MSKILTIFMWEIRKLFSSWRRTFTLFLLPAIFLVGMLNLFPVLINYMTTGSLNKQPVMVVNAPDSFRDYLDENIKTNAFKYEFISADEFKEFKSDKADYHKRLHQGLLICYFYAGEDTNDFDGVITSYYKELSNGNAEAKSDAVVCVVCDANSITSQTRAEQLRVGILKDYQGSLIDKLGGEFGITGSSLFSVDSFNPVTDFEDYRTSANTTASRVVSGVLMILMYYTTYSLVSDMFASERDRGFMDKLIMTPVSRRKIYIGKILAIDVIVSFSTLITLGLLFLSSWMNRSNDAMSLLPFGMLLTPSELLIVVLTIPVTALIMTAICVSTVFALKNMQDITTNLQLPLIYFLGDFFLQMFRGTRPTTLEYFIPVHNAMQLISESFMAQDKLWHVLLVLLLNAGLAIAVFATTFRKEERK
ncbi:MAG: ABC transporter permease [Ruminococcaceae bacterium]|nr:ABC transporter permease [Oscillospiraceae bacterium]